jgi:hypothetical protein
VDSALRWAAALASFISCILPTSLSYPRPLRHVTRRARGAIEPGPGDIGKRFWGKFPVSVNQEFGD